MQIESCSFGSMVIEGNEYRKDLIIFADKVLPDWRRKQGHRLSIDDLEEVLCRKPEFLIVGRGAYGAMEIPGDTRTALKQENIMLIEGETGRVFKIFNEYAQEGKNVAGAFHLTC